MYELLYFTADIIKKGQIAAIITVTQTVGSSPSSAGQMMVVLPDGSTKGTVGGGATEHLLISRAIKAMNDGERIFPFKLDHAQNGMVCGGSMQGFGHVIGAGKRLIIFGGGHIAKSLADMAHLAGFCVIVIEDREKLRTSFDHAEFKLIPPSEYDSFELIKQSDYVVIATRGHESDFEALTYALKANPKYIGVIASEKKSSELFNTLINEGISEDKLDKVYSPIGLDIAKETPSEIAVAILAQILLIKNDGTLNHMSRPLKSRN